MDMLIVDDEKTILDFLSRHISEKLGHNVKQFTSGDDAINFFKKNPCPMILTDIKMPGIDGFRLLKRIKSLPEGKDTNIVLMTGYQDMDSAIKALRAGAYDYLQKPLNLEELTAVINRVDEIHTIKKEHYELKDHFEKKVAEANYESEEKIRILQGCFKKHLGLENVGIFSEKFKKTIELAQKLHYDRSVPVLIEGETGTGKEIISHIIHYGRENVTVPLVILNCPAVSPTIFESELFGYEGGAYTSSKKGGMNGKLFAANKGTILFDEIGDLPLDLQPKLLRFLQDKSFYKVGGNKKIKLDIRILFATNKNLELLVKSDQFRKDLFFRINVVKINIPPLRERKEEIMPLANMFLDFFSIQKNRKFKKISNEAKKVLEKYGWPGNVRELKNVIERVVIMHNEEVVLPGHIQFIGAFSENKHFSDNTLANPKSLILPDENINIGYLEKEIIKKALKKFSNSQTRTALYLNISRNSLRTRMKNYDLF